ncbi:MFS transporter [Peristeroidobacter agariperforans]|uniref:MFS transporter n=1 Tax=Peristeroidobacter agariperforans TaxID=268404 RepID=UPI001300B24D|nr:MFS transporter [Peristeroidobacter agariperforans]
MLALGAFAVGTDAFVIAGILPSVGATLRVSTAAAGQLVTVFSLAYAIAAPILGALTAGWSRRSALVIALGLFCAGNAMTAAAPSFILALLSRIIAAAGAGLFTANASATAAILAGPQHRGRAISRVMMGLTSSLVLGAPLGTAIANVSDWRLTLWLVAALGLLAGAAIFAKLPEIRETDRPRLKARFPPLQNPNVRNDLLRAIVIFTGVYLPYTYISVVYQALIAADAQWLSLLLVIFGGSGTLGNLAAGALADRVGPVPVILGACISLAAVLLAVPSLAHSPAWALLAVALSGLFSFALTTPQQHLLLAHGKGAHLSLLTGLYQSCVYLAVSSRACWARS